MVRARFNQLIRSGALSSKQEKKIDKALATAERVADKPGKGAVVQLEKAAGELDGSPGQQELAEAVDELADTLR